MSGGMKTSGIFRVAEHTVKVPKFGDTVTFIPFGDIHREAKHFCNSKWRDFLKFAKAAPNPVFLGLGDYHDFGSTSERHALQNAALHEDTRRTISLMLQDKCKAFVDEIAFMAPNLIGMIDGNHDMQFELENGQRTSMTDYMAALLQVPYLGVAALCGLSIQSSTSVASVDIYAHHGLGGAGTVGGSINRVAKMAEHADARIYLMGHTHDRGIMPLQSRMRRVPGKFRVREETRFAGRTGSFLKAYEHGQSSYNVDAGRAPANLGWIHFDLSLRRLTADDGERELTVEIKGVA